MAASNAPVLSLVPSLVLGPGQPFEFTNTVLGIVAGPLEFSLGSGAPYGASINPTNGVFHWTPACHQGNSTNSITVRVAEIAAASLLKLTWSLRLGRMCFAPTQAPSPLKSPMDAERART